MTAAGRRTRGVREVLARASGMRGSPRVSGLRPMYQGTTRTPTPAWASRTTGVRAMRGGGGDRRPLHHQEPTVLLGDSARTWLKHLPRDKIKRWADLRWVFVGNFQGTYTRPRKKWELRNCNKQPGESLREYICASPSTAPSFSEYHLAVPKRHDLHLPHPSTQTPHAQDDAGTPRHCEQPCRRRGGYRGDAQHPSGHGGSRSWTMARAHPRTSRRRRRTTSAVVTTTWSWRSNAKHRAPRATRQAWSSKGPLREAPGCVVPTP
jgi:hypothetical protein